MDNCFSQEDKGKNKSTPENRTQRGINSNPKANTGSQNNNSKANTGSQNNNCLSETPLYAPEQQKTQAKGKEKAPTGNIPHNAPTQEESKQIQNEHNKNAQREKFLKDYPKAAEMLKKINIEEEDKNKLESLKQEFIKYEFGYTMAPIKEDDFLKGTKKEGDCSTLAKAYVKIAKEYLGIESVELGSKKGDFFVPNGGKVLDVNKATGNVDNGKHWVFTNHYWVESPIGTIDLLFLGQAVNQSQWIEKSGEGKEGAIDYRIFGNYKVYESNYMATLANRYATNLDEAQKGKAAADAAAAEAVAMPSRAKKQSSNLLTCCTVM